MITCPACSKQNQDHYRFCLGCGAELPRGASAADDEAKVAEVADEDTSLGGAASDAPPATQRDGAASSQRDSSDAGLPPGKCPDCDYVNPPTNRFCASCGFRLDAAPPAAPQEKPAPPDPGDALAILVALDPEGNEVGRHKVSEGETIIGRDTGGIFAADTFMSPQHAIFTAEAGGVRVRDNSSLNGVFRKLIAEQRLPLVSGQRFRVGQELLQFDSLEPTGPDGDGVTLQGSTSDGIVGLVSLVVGRKTAKPSFPLAERGLNLGRERGDVLFPEDGYVSGLHCHISVEGGNVFVTDLGSSNGTFVQLTSETELSNGDVLLMGQQLFRVTI